MLVIEQILAAAVLAQGALALIILGLLGTRRVPLVGRGAVKMRDIAIDNQNWPQETIKVSNAFNNQFQLPVLLYVGAGLSFWMGAGLIDVLLAWAFVVTRYVHAGIHVTHNYVPARFAAYTAGYAILCLYWLWLAFRIITIAGVG